MKLEKQAITLKIKIIIVELSRNEKKKTYIMIIIHSLKNLSHRFTFEVFVKSFIKWLVFSSNWMNL